MLDLVGNPGDGFSHNASHTNVALKQNYLLKGTKNKALKLIISQNTWLHLVISKPIPRVSDPIIH